SPPKSEQPARIKRRANKIKTVRALIFFSRDGFDRVRFATHARPLQVDNGIVSSRSGFQMGKNVPDSPTLTNP
ncbi:MAG TPA: hypothetical protein VJ768_07145, partial [Anaerolineales bacterium]|nr:hypothetical protein [Anaerolineales bacterium]